MWDLPGPGLKPVSPALAGGFLTTAPPGKPREILSYLFCILYLLVDSCLIKSEASLISWLGPSASWEDLGEPLLYCQHRAHEGNFVTWVFWPSRSVETNPSSVWEPARETSSARAAVRRTSLSLSLGDFVCGHLVYWRVPFKAPFYPGVSGICQTPAQLFRLVNYLATIVYYSGSIMTTYLF